jgi:putative DNA methylase
LPLDAINTAGVREKSIRHGRPSTLHRWWARRPLATARAVLFAQLVDDPSAWPELFPTEALQQRERERLFRIIEDLVQWENTTNEEALDRARREIRRSWARHGLGAAASRLSDDEIVEAIHAGRIPALPGVHDPFAGGGAIPLEAQRLGLDAYASDLNPVAVTINKAMIEIPPRFRACPPVNPQDRLRRDLDTWHGVQGLASDVRYYGRWMREQAQRRIGHLYPPITITPELAAERPDLKHRIGKQLTVIAWLWARTVKSPNPAFAHVEVPLVTTFILSGKPGREAYVEPIMAGDAYRFTVRVGAPPAWAKHGTRLARGAHFRCLLSGMPIKDAYIKAESMAGRMGARMLAIVAEGPRGRVYLPPTAGHEAIARSAQPTWKPDVEMPENPRWFSPPLYGLTTYGDLFTSRQLAALTTFADLVGEAMECVTQDARAAGMPDDGIGLAHGGAGATAYAQAVGVYLALALDRIAMTGNSLVRWNGYGENAQHCFGRQALPMIWDFAEPDVFASATGSIEAAVFSAYDSLNRMNPFVSGFSEQADAQTQTISANKIISTDPPYYDNIGYADLSDFFYVWLRRMLRPIFPDLYATISTPKAEELVATPYRHGGKQAAGRFFMEGMTRALHNLAVQAHPDFPVTIYYAFKQQEMGEEKQGTSATSDQDAPASLRPTPVSTGWETFLEAVIQAGFAITGTWPMRTEMRTRQTAMNANALASSIVLVCRLRPADAPIATRRAFINALKAELPSALAALQRANIAPVDLAQASIGPGMAIYTRYARVVDAQGNPVRVREALGLINQALDEALREQEGEFDPATRWALAWFAQHGFAEGDFGVAETLSKAKNTSIEGLAGAGILEAKRGRVRLLKPSELTCRPGPRQGYPLHALGSGPSPDPGAGSRR